MPSFAWTRGKSEFLQTDLTEDGKPVRLEAVIFRPSGAGPFPLAVINHGSTGRGSNPRRFTETWFAPALADFLNDRGWIVAFPQRRGRGKSDELYDEGLVVNRTQYTGDIDIALRGADRALSDIDAAIAVLRRRQNVAPTPVLIGGVSRGGVLSIAYAGLHPSKCSASSTLSAAGLSKALRTRAPCTARFSSEGHPTDSQRSGSMVNMTRFTLSLIAGIISQLSRKPVAKANSLSLICRLA